MKRIAVLSSAFALITSCQNCNSCGDVVSQTYVHKYGFDLSEEEWMERAQDGQVVTVLKTGVKVARSFENGQLHGTTTYTFPNSSVIEKSLTYDAGVLLKETLNDSRGMPISEQVYEFDNRTIITFWDEKGTPLSIEEYEDEVLVDGKYFTTNHELEGKVEGGNGQRVKRDRAGALLSRDRMENGQIASRTTYHPNGEIHTVSNYQGNELHGEQLKFTALGRPLMKLNWNHGVLDGLKIVYRNGIKIAEIPYNNGQRHGKEKHFDDLGYLTAEIEWRNDKKHGCSLFHGEEESQTQWFYKGQTVSFDRFEMMENRDFQKDDFSNQ